MTKSKFDSGYNCGKQRGRLLADGPWSSVDGQPPSRLFSKLPRGPHRSVGSSSS